MTANRPQDVFRQHESVDVPMASALLRQLCAEWTLLHASDRARTAITGWAVAGQLPVDAHSPGDLIDQIDAAPASTRDDILRALLALLHRGEHLAGRVLLQAMLPCLSKVPHSCSAPRGESSYEETLQRVVAEFWSVIARDRTLAHPNVAGRLWMDTVKAITRHRRSADAWEEHTELSDEVDAHGHDPAGSELSATPIEEVAIKATTFADLSSDATLIEVLVVAYRTQTFTLEETRFLAEVYLAGDKDQKETAMRLGLSHSLVRQRSSRLRSRLVAAYAANSAAA